MPDDLSRRRSLPTVALVGALLPDPVPEVRMLRAWLDTWTGIGQVTVGMDRQGYDLQLTKSTPTAAGERPSTCRAWSTLPLP